MISVESNSESSKMENWLKNLSKITPETVLKETGIRGVKQLRDATPKDSGITAAAWNYQVENVKKGVELAFSNNSAGNNTYNVVQGIRYGHGTGTGGYVPPNDFVSPIINALVEGNINAFVRSVIK